MSPAAAPLLRWGLLSTARINDALPAVDPERRRFVAIYVGLSNGLHAEWAVRALETGKHVLCEKPFSDDQAAVERAFEVADQRGLVLAEGLMWRHHAQVRRAFAGIMRFPGEVLATIECSLTARPRHAPHAVGSAGELRLDDPWHGRRPVVRLTRADGRVEELEVPSARSAYALELEDLEAAVAGERPPLLGRVDALGQARTLAALRASAENSGHATPVGVP